MPTLSIWSRPSRAFFISIIASIFFSTPSVDIHHSTITSSRLFAVKGIFFSIFPRWRPRHLSLPPLGYSIPSPFCFLGVHTTLARSLVSSSSLHHSASSLFSSGYRFFNLLAPQQHFILPHHNNTHRLLSRARSHAFPHPSGQAVQSKWSSDKDRYYVGGQD